MLPNWLHGVALRTALKARTMAAKRGGREKQITEMPEPEAIEREIWHDLLPLLDQELNGLPEIYRLPIILCDLEGKTIKEATQQIGCPQGTLAGRLARGRKLLARRFAKRGLVLSVGSLASVVAQNATSAAVPTSLVTSTIQAATKIVARHVSIAGVVPANVVSLTEGVLKSMLLNKLKAAAVALLLVAVLIGAAGTIDPTQAADPPKAEPRNKVATPEATPQDVLTPIAAPARAYAFQVKLLEARAGEPNVLSCPKIVWDEGQDAQVGLTDGPRNLLEEIALDEKIKIGTFISVRVKRLGGNKVRLVLSLQKNEVEDSSVNEIRVLGSSVQAVQVVELKKPTKIILQKDSKGTAQRWVELVVDEVQVDEGAIAPPAIRATKHAGVKN
jgi:hypothetical protein